MKALTKIDAKTLRGGCVTVRDKALLPFGAFSLLQNVRNMHNGFEQRPGQRKLHTTADGTNKVLSLYQFRKTNTTEKHFYAQMSDGDVLEATNLPPTVTTGAFGSEIFSGSADQIPASWGNLGDMMLFSNGKEQHQIFGGTTSPVERFIVFKGSAAIPDVPQGGEDYSNHVQTSDDSLTAILDDLNTYANYNCIFFRTPVPCNGLTVTMATSKGNANAASISVYYWKNDHTWTAVSGLSDGTDSGGACFAQSGSISWTAPADIMPRYAFGSSGFWYQIRVSAALGSQVEISKVLYSSAWQSIQNVWDGAVVYGIEVHVEGATQWETYAAGAVNIDELAAGKKIYVAFSDPVEGIYIDPGGTPNATGCTLTSLKYWDGNSWESVGTVTDGTSGMSQPGWITFPRCASQPLQLHTSIYQAYWYEIIWGAQISADTVVAISGMPYFDIEEFGKGYCNAVWKDRACYAFDRYGNYIYVSATQAPMVLNGNDYGILKAGDGRSNKVVAMKRFHNELMVWQEELGVEGGCVTLFEGYSPATFGKIVLSSKIGGMNAKAVAVVDGVLTATATEETIKTLAFFLSRYGVCVCDGMTISIVSDDIQNYFDPTKDECIRYGYEKEMWLEHDPTHNCIRMGLVSGSGATVPNVFPVFDLVTKTWSFDTPAQELSCMTNIEPVSGTQYPVVQVGGGVDHGTIYQLNYGIDDVSTPVTSVVQMVLNYKALFIQLREILVRFAAQNAGAARLDVLLDGNLKFSKSLPMTAERSGETTRRHRFGCDAVGDLIVLEIRNSSRNEKMSIYEIGLATFLWEQR